VLQDEATKAESESGLPMFGDRVFHPSTGIARSFAEALRKLGNQETGCAFVHSPALT
jgi:hypothetical protein